MTNGGANRQTEPMSTAATRPTWWPRFSSTLRSTALTARLGLALGIAFGLCFLTGLLSYYQYSPWAWLPTPTGPQWGYRLTQGIHVTTGLASIPLVAVKLWSVYPNVFRWPPFPSVKRTIERVSLALLVAASLVQLVTGFFNLLGWYPFPWDFIVVHYALAYVVIGSVLLHVGTKLPDINYGLRADLPAADVLTEIPWNENPDSHSNAGERPAPPTPAISRRGVLAAAGARGGRRRGRGRRTDADTAGAARPAGAAAAEPRPARPAGQQDRRGGPGAGAGHRLAPRGHRPEAVTR